MKKIKKLWKRNSLWKTVIILSTIIGVTTIASIISYGLISSIILLPIGVTTIGAIISRALIADNPKNDIKIKHFDITKIPESMLCNDGYIKEITDTTIKPKHIDDDEFLYGVYSVPYEKMGFAPSSKEQKTKTRQRTMQ